MSEILTAEPVKPYATFYDRTTEANEQEEASSIPRTGVSLELGCHFYPHEWTEMAARGHIPPQHLERGLDEYNRLCRRVGADSVSTCIFLDGYDNKLKGIVEPQQAVDLLQDCAQNAGVPLHYIGSEWACAGDLADDVLTWVISRPPRNFTGTKRPTADQGWVSSGLLDGDIEEYCDEAVPHSISTAVQIFKDIPGRKKQPGVRLWACPYLAGVWQLARLGLLLPRHMDIRDEPIDEQTTWQNLPLVTRLEPDAPPFSADRTLTILPKRYTSIVHAERLILDSIRLPENLHNDRQLPQEASGLAEYVLETD